MLRGPQTPGELRSRADRLFSFDDLAAVQSTLERLAARAPHEAGAETGGETSSETTVPLTTILPRQPGSREARYAHLLGDQPNLASARSLHPAGDASPPEGQLTSDSATAQRLARMEADIASLTTALQDLRTRVELLKPNN
jgi:uncharacterized protein YceH (UPF0502 family)